MMRAQDIHDKTHKQLEPPWRLHYPQNIVHNSYKTNANDIITAIFEYIWQKFEQLT